jgi:hypothetical protein
MIQRIQSLWLLISAALAAVYVNFPVFKGMLMNSEVVTIRIREHLTLFALSVIAGIISFVAIFLFKNRKQQKALIILNTLLCTGIFATQYFIVEERKVEISIAQGDWQLIALIPLFMVILLLFSYQNIRADEKLLSSADRMR